MGSTMGNTLDEMVPNAVFHLTGTFTDAEGKAHETIQILDSDRKMVVSVTLEDGQWVSYLIAHRLDSHWPYFRSLIERARTNPRAFELCRAGKCRGWHWDTDNG